MWLKRFFTTWKIFSREPFFWRLYFSYRFIVSKYPDWESWKKTLK